jgi:hypothetical protein
VDVIWLCRAQLGSCGYGVVLSVCAWLGQQRLLGHSLLGDIISLPGPPSALSWLLLPE